MNKLLSILNKLSKFFGKTNSDVKLPISVNGVNDIKKSCTAPRSYY